MRSEKMMMLRLFRRNPSRLPLLYLNPIRNGAASNPQTNLSTFTLSFFSSASNLPHDSESPKIEEPSLDFFRSYGFTDPQIERFIHKYPTVRFETMKPKFDHLLAYGFSPSELIRTICFYPTILHSSLKERIEPNLNLLEATFDSKSYIIKAIIRGPWLISNNLEKNVIPNIKILRENSIPMDKIARLFTKFPLVLDKDRNIITETINKLKGMGMSPSTMMFIIGMNGMLASKKETWERKMELYRSFGWSEKDTFLAFSRQPICMQLSDDKIKRQMEFFVEKLRWDLAMVLRMPVVLTLSLEGRIIPRCAVLDVLTKNGLWNGKPKLYGLLTMSEKDFKERFVDKYEKEVPQVIDAYQGKLDFVGFETKY